jgi:hypothetical protein
MGMTPPLYASLLLKIIFDKLRFARYRGEGVIDSRFQ